MHETLGWSKIYLAKTTKSYAREEHYCGCQTWIMGPSMDSAVGPKSSSFDSPSSTTTLQILKKTNLIYTFIIDASVLLQSNLTFYFICYQDQILNAIKFLKSI